MIEYSRERKRVLVWGFYNQGNIGDDLMAVMFSELLLEIGITPVIFSNNDRFTKMGYEATEYLEDTKVDAVLMGGGAFFKSNSNPDTYIEKSVNSLAEFIRKNNLPTFGASLGSDGISDVNQLSQARYSVITAPSFIGASVRLKSDVSLGAKNLSFLPDIVFATRYIRPRIKSGLEDSSTARQDYLINLSRRSLLKFPQAIWAAREGKKALLLAHSGIRPTGGEIRWPFLPHVLTEDIASGVDRIGEAKAVISSKLHPGVISLSMGKMFIPLAKRPKTSAFIEQHIQDGVLSYKSRRQGGEIIKTNVGDGWQAELWCKYREKVKEVLQ